MALLQLDPIHASEPGGAVSESIDKQGNWQATLRDLHCRAGQRLLPRVGGKGRSHQTHTETTGQTGVPVPLKNTLCPSEPASPDAHPPQRGAHAALGDTLSLHGQARTCAHTELSHRSHSRPHDGPNKPHTVGHPRPGPPTPGSGWRQALASPSPQPGSSLGSGSGARVSRDRRVIGHRGPRGDLEGMRPRGGGWAPGLGEGVHLASPSQPVGTTHTFCRSKAHGSTCSGRTRSRTGDLWRPPRTHPGPRPRAASALPRARHGSPAPRRPALPSGVPRTASTCHQVLGHPRSSHRPWRHRTPRHIPTQTPQTPPQ